MAKLLLFLMLLPLPSYAEAVLKPSVTSGFEALSQPDAIGAGVQLRSAQAARDSVVLQFKLAGDPTILELKLSTPHNPPEGLDLKQFSIACDREAWRPHSAALTAIGRAIDRQFDVSVWQQPQTDVKPDDNASQTPSYAAEPAAAQLPFTWAQGSRGQWASFMILLGFIGLIAVTQRQLAAGQRK